jgi:hypothetical protein
VCLEGPHGGPIFLLLGVVRRLATGRVAPWTASGWERAA